MNSFIQPRHGRFARIIWALAVVARGKRIDSDLNRPFFNLGLAWLQAGDREVGFDVNSMEEILITSIHPGRVILYGLNQRSLLEVNGLSAWAGIGNIFGRAYATPSLSQIADCAIVNQVGFAPELTLGVLFSVFEIVHGFSLHVLSPVGIWGCRVGRLKC